MKVAFIITTFLSFNLFSYVPENYQELGACEKQEILWQNAEETKHETLPKMNKLGGFQVLKMSLQGVAGKKEWATDFSPKDWKKYIHKRGSMAKVKIVPTSNNPYTGAFDGADCALLRLSLTYDPASKDNNVAPGLALKVLRDGVASANVSALYTIDGQGENFNFFANSLSNIVPAGKGVGPYLMHKIFSRVTDYPEQLKASNLSRIDENGEAIKESKSPRHIFFVPNPEHSGVREPHDVREDFNKIPRGSIIYSIYALSDRYGAKKYDDYKEADIENLLQNSTHIADIVSTSSFISSEFGDTGIFFQHETR